MENTAEIQNHLTNKILQQGALVVGYTIIRQKEPVIVIGFPFSDQWILNHPFYITKRFGEEVWTSWKLLRDVTQVLRSEGYSADLKTPLSVFGDFRPLAVAAGLGNWGKNGLVTNTNYGSRLLFAAVFTNAPLQVSLTGNSGLINESCDNCTLCIDACPAKAFQNNRFHKMRCFPKAIRGCSECLQVCRGRVQLH